MQSLLTTISSNPLLKSLDTEHIDSNAAGKIAYDIDWSLIDFHLSQGQSTILDSPCFYTEMVEKGIRMTGKNIRQHTNMLNVILMKLMKLNIE